MRTAPLNDEPSAVGFRPVRLVLVVFAALLLVTFASNWYVAQVSLPRYCHETELVLQRLGMLVSEDTRIPPGARRDHIVAARLEFLVPPAVDEPLDDYLERVRRELQQRCR